jgi:uncharacterized protein (DUF1330 family)
LEVLLSAPVTFDLHKPTTRKDVNAMTVTVLAEIKVNPAKQDELAQYFAATMPLIERAGARILAQLNINEVVIGKNMSKSMYVVEYPSREAVYEVFSSPEYEAIIPVRDAAFDVYQISICDPEGLGDFPPDLPSEPLLQKA